MSSDTWIPVSIDFINGDILYLFTFDTSTDFSSTVLSDGIILTPFIELINCFKTEIIFLSSKAIVIVSIILSFFRLRCKDSAKNRFSEEKENKLSFLSVRFLFKSKTKQNKSLIFNLHSCPLSRL